MRRRTGCRRTRKVFSEVFGWEREWSAQLPHLLEAQRQGVNVKALESRPSLPEHLSFVVRAYRDLAADSGPSGLIPFSAVALYCQAVGIADVFWLWDRIQALQAAQTDG